MLAVALVIPQFADDVRSDTYSINYGRVCGWVETEPVAPSTEELLAVAVEARKALGRANRPGRRASAKIRQASIDATNAYADAAEIRKYDAVLKVQGLANGY